MSSSPTSKARLSVLREEASRFPRHPGVYIMRDAEGECVYVGKAKNLRNRVRSYFGAGDGRFQLPHLLARVHSIEKIITDTEHSAFVLERDLITKYKPRYNIRLKDDKAYLHVRIQEDAEWPRLELVRRIEHDGAKYFGPYTFSTELRTVLDLIKRVVPLRTCSDTVFHNRSRPCLEYQIKRCAGPCCLPVDPEEYSLWVRQAEKILAGDTKGLHTQLQSSMERASEELRFEDAADYRDKLETLENFSKGMHLVSIGGEGRDVFAIERMEEIAVVSVLIVRNGRIDHTKHFLFERLMLSDDELLAETINQFYQGEREIPDELVLPFLPQEYEFLQEELEARRGKAVLLHQPQRGLKYRLLGIAQLNAHEHFLASFDQERRYDILAERLAKLLHLQSAPRRIECVDISNFQGSHIVGAMVSFLDGSPDKQAYKRYNISRQGKPDDFSSIHEVVLRRLRRGAEEEDLPDLLIVDGGKGQLDAALRAREESGVSLEIVSLAKMRRDEEASSELTVQKKPERIFVPGLREPIVLEAGDELTHFVQRIRDEAHRFVIQFHRSKRERAGLASVLDGIAGVGPERKRRLLKAFGSREGIRKQTLEKIAEAGRMSPLLARKIIDAIDAEIPSTPLHQDKD